MNIKLEDLFKLSRAERIELAEDLWDSVAADPQSFPSLTDGQVAEIERRLVEHARDPSCSIAWDELRVRLERMTHVR